MDFDTLPWLLMILAYLFLMFKHGSGPWANAVLNSSD